jgi:Domain of unknown function (DUF4062)/NACHT domain/Pentapeptide repeats (9 copies)
MEPISTVLELFTSAAAEKVKEKLSRTEFVVRLLERAGLKPDKPPPDFDGVYVYSLIQYGVGRPPQALQLFREPEIRDAFRRSFAKNDPLLLESEAERFLEWNRIGDEWREAKIDPRREFALFSAAFHEVIDATRDPAETRRDHQLAAILDRLEALDDLSAIREELAALRAATYRRQFVLEPSGTKLKIFISSRMKELRDLRSIMRETLENRDFDAFLYESNAGARPDTVVEASLSEVEAADVYVGIFDTTYGEVTIEEFRHARSVNKPCFVYIRDKNAAREPRLQRFLDAEVSDPRTGLAPAYFDSAPELAKRAAEDILAWLVRQHRILSAQLKDVSTSDAERDRLRKEVERLRSLTHDTLPEGGALDLLAANLDAWFRVSGYPPEAYEVQGPDRYERLINVPDRERRYTRVLVYAVEGPAELADLHALRRRATEQGVGEGWLISAIRKSPGVVQAIAAQTLDARPKFACYTFDELIDLGADFTGYFNWLEGEVEDRGIDKKYIPLACTKTEFDPATNQRIGVAVFGEDTGWIDTYINQWLDDPSKEHISILGQFGTGKTWFALHYAWVALQEYRKAQREGRKRPRLPLYITLRDHAKATDVQNLFSDFFFSKQRIEIRNYSVFEELNRMGRFLLIFDGFDEMADRVDRDKVIENFWKLARVVAPRSKVILTSRTEHFPNDEESRKLLSAELQASTSTQKMTSPQFEVLELQQLTPQQIRQLLAGNHLSEAAIARVMQNQELLDLASRPIMIDLITESLAEIERGERLDISRIYLYAIRRKMERDITSGRTFTSLADKLYFLCELSWAMLSQNKMSLNYQDFPAEISRVFGPRLKSPTDRDYFQYDMMGQNMLIRKDGDYSPAHRSLLEFCAAYKLAAEMGLLADDFTSVAREQSGVDRTGTPEARTWGQHFLASGDRSRPLARFVPESPENLKKTLGSRPITPAMRDLLIPMLERDSASAALNALIQRSLQDDAPAAAVIAGNALALLIGLDIEAVRGTRFTGARFADLSLKGVDLSRIDFSGAVFERCTMEQIGLSNVKMGETVWRQCRVVAADLRGADLRGASLYDTLFGLGIIFPKIAMNAGGILASAIGRKVELWDVRSRKRIAVISTERGSRALVFIGRSLLATQHFVTDFDLWDVSNPAQPVAFVWPSALAGRTFRNIAPVGDSRRAWLLADESLLSVDLDTGTISAEFETVWDRQEAATAAPDGVHVATARASLEFWVNSDGYTFDPNKSNPKESDLKEVEILLLAFSPSARYLAAATERSYDKNSDSSVTLYIINTEDRSIRSWTSPACTAIAFVSDTLLLSFTTSGRLHLLDLATGKQALRLESESNFAPCAAFNSSGTALIYSDRFAVLRIIDTRPFVSKSSKTEPLSPTDPGVNLDGVTLEEDTWPEWWRNADVRPAVPANHVPNPRFGVPAISLVADTRCEGLQLTGISGLEEGVRDVFIARGAVYQPGFLERIKYRVSKIFG